MSTASPEVGRQIAAATASRGVRSLEAPVGGGPDAAAAGKLIAFVGGSMADVEAQRAVLHAMAERVLHVGATGAGYAVKLIVNMMWFGRRSRRRRR
jgi:3-hydroxyisobutyrate dehydrogenase